MDDWMARTPDWMEGMTDLQRDTVARLESREKSCQMRFESLRLDEIDWKVERKKLLAEREALIKQRDEARREVCHLEAVRSSFLGFQKNIKDLAAQRGWDCFKEGGGA